LILKLARGEEWIDSSEEARAGAGVEETRPSAAMQQVQEEEEEESDEDAPLIVKRRVSSTG
jgi:hypothetical protein